MRLSVESMVYGADGLAHDADGKAVFVQGAVTGDVVEAECVSSGKSFSRARTVEVLEPSPLRVQPPCPLVDVCGGCPWGNLSRAAQLEAKQANVEDTLERVGRFPREEVKALVEPIRSTGDDWGYRNKVELASYRDRGKLRFGMHGRDPERMVPVKSCPLFEKRHGRVLASVSGALGYLVNSRDLSLERVGIRASARTGNVQVALWTPTGGFPRAQVKRVLEDACKTTGVVRVMSKGDKRARRVSSTEVLGGVGRWAERIAGGRMFLSAPSFFQVNTPAAEILVDLVMQALDPKEDELAVDLYCGAGTFTLPLARRAGFVCAVESYGPAVRDLTHNVNKANLANVEPIGGDAAREFPDEDVDVLVVDPPRAGLDEKVVELVSSTSARDVAYVSCDPATLARDLRRFCDRGVFKPVSVTPVDLFPQTYHVETVTHLTRA